MKKNSDTSSPYATDSPRFTREMMKRSMPFTALPAALQRSLTPDSAGDEKQDTELVSLHLSRDVAEALRATGSDWQGRVDQHLREWLQSSSGELKRAS